MEGGCYLTDKKTGTAPRRSSTQKHNKPLSLLKKKTSLPGRIAHAMLAVQAWYEALPQAVPTGCATKPHALVVHVDVPSSAATHRHVDVRQTPPCVMAQLSCIGDVQG